MKMTAGSLRPYRHDLNWKQWATELGHDKISEKYLLIQRQKMVI